MSKTEILQLLVENGYVPHPIFNFFHNPKNSLSRYFLFKNDKEIISGKLKWGQLSLKEFKTIQTASFNPSSYSLKTMLDRKREAEYRRRIQINHLKLQGKYKEIPGVDEPEIPEVTEIPETN